MAIETSNLAISMCGKIESMNSELDEILKHLSKSIDLIINEIKQLKEYDANKFAFLSPFFGRSLLELGCTALIAKLDPFRILIIREKQMADYEIDKPHKSSIRWQGDVLAEKQIDDLWNDKFLKNPTRALLGDYYCHIFWHKGIEALFDQVEDSRGGDWFVDIKNYDANGLCAMIRGKLARLYSSLSKGIHHEFVIPPGVSFDKDTVNELLIDSINMMAVLGLVSNLVSHVKNPLNLSYAIELFERIQNIEVP